MMVCFLKEKKERDLTQSYDQNPCTNRKINNQLTTQKRHKNFDYTTIADRCRTMSCSHPTGVVKPVHGYPTFPFTAKAV